MGISSILRFVLSIEWIPATIYYCISHESAYDEDLKS